jgi:tellurite methyltransferase
LKPGGLLFARRASTIGLEARVVPIRGRVHLLPDGSERYLVDEPLLLRITAERGGELLDPLKTTVVQDQRAMTTWVVRKTGDHGGNGGHNEGTEVTEANEEDARPPVHPPS